MEKIISCFQGKGIRLTIMSPPTCVYSPRKFSFWNLLIPDEIDRGIKFSEKLEKLCNKYNINYIDIHGQTEYLQKYVYKEGWKNYYYPNDSHHLNDDGHRILRDIILSHHL